MSRLTRDGTAEPVSRDQILRHARGQGNIHFPCSADHEQDWQPYPVDPYYSAIFDDHTYILTSVHKNFSTTDSVLVDVVYRRAVPLFHKPSRAILQLGSSEGVNLRVWVCAPPEAHRVSSISRCKLYWECS